ncbi:MAG: 50S ribosomal protein L17 [Candidatus Levybacteria bacterium RIFCSPHIGHO2_02_FULL_37_13]|nr:MAG: 50S ribosomal protein L17 [Candidatus Levybacteria bacterium RIFCSPHIGHO2_02_FULL_37_13]OGH29809.1 MAG: 50S ribosomal protein L17 [Candidatus Levybacteria bacterium RIFCSPHIGHO2_12_FULL_37_9]OGH39998.1 MAG: 50S ribosomal protein L17 [Candidatus Levybacteria bacterium RIFCSPLOWO2_01_FULL_37_26]
MRKNVFGRQFKRDKNERAALFKGLISSLVLHERIKTTEEKAKAIKGEVDKIITKAKKGDLAARHLLQGQLAKKEVEKLILEIAPRFNGRQGGYTRTIRIGRRFSDNAQMVLMEWVVKSSIDVNKFSASKQLSASVVARETSDKKPATTETQKKREARKKRSAKK